MKYTEEDCMDEVLKRVPGFQNTWQEHQEFWDGEKAGLVLDMIELASYTQTLLESGSERELSTIFQLIEEMLLDGSEKVKGAVITGFLETIVNAVEEESPYLPLLARLLGEKSKAYCAEWLTFSGGDLPGISN